MKIRFAFAVASLLIANLTFGQTNWREYKNQQENSRKSIDDYVDNGTVRRNVAPMKSSNPQIEALVKRYIDENASNPTLDGYRVQLFFGKRDEAQEMKTEYLKTYPETPAYITYQAPNFKVRVGNFRTQLEAEKFLHNIRADFPTGFIVPEKIELPNID